MNDDLERKWAEARQLQSLVSRWDGCTARIIHYERWHSTFVIEVYETGRATALSLECITPSHICGPLLWSRCRLAVSVREEIRMGRPWNVFVLSDEAIPFELRCLHLRAREEAPPKR